MPKTGIIPELSGAWERLARGHERALDETERALATALRRLVQEATDRLLLEGATVDKSDRKRARVALLVTAGALAARLARDAEQAVSRGQRDAREAARARQAMALQQAARELSVEDGIPVPPLSDAPEDAGAALAVAGAAAARWRAHVSAALLRWERRGEGSLEEDLRRAQRDAMPAGAAAIVVGEAYNDEHDEGALYLAREHKGAPWLPLIVRRWDATRDKKLCARCRAINGSYRPLGMQWPQGARPGELHKHCRCHEALVVLPVPLRMPQTDEARANIPSAEREAA